ncbi:hypothetical protein B9Q13_04805 [Candidatus Marsarchaeota G2 archaeon ECH_B_SAG-G16]|uniref:Uncharacterized protein n=1 Tax=Candidatus Marsarchaeota G2 archaeon ECH_B_SAG-G16 TaxID=1978167 RepID=A0A2R6C0D4_9ARCH|nr:MAG: hypothetical protein B9Q13_04805 [Candidatus Marsarchaeota G2 archaeon ECH_B_SAG-G16]
MVHVSEDKLEAVTREMERVGKRAIAFQRYVLRRAWGVYYAIWVFAFFWFVFLPYLILSFVSQNADIAFYLGYTLVGGLAGYATWVNFSKAYRTLILKRSLFGERRSYYRWFFVAFWISFFIAIQLLFHFFGSRVLSVYYLLLLSVPLVNLFKALF